MLRKSYQTVVLYQKTTTLQTIQNTKRYIFSSAKLTAPRVKRGIVGVDRKKFSSDSDKDNEASQTIEEGLEEPIKDAKKPRHVRDEGAADVDVNKASTSSASSGSEFDDASGSDANGSGSCSETELSTPEERLFVAEAEFATIDKMFEEGITIPDLARVKPAMDPETFEAQEKIMRIFEQEKTQLAMEEKNFEMREVNEELLESQEKYFLKDKEKLVAEKARTMQKLQGYEQSEKILSAIQDKLNASATQEQAIQMREYLQSKLSMLDTPYSRYIDGQLKNRSLNEEQAADRQEKHLLSEIYNKAEKEEAFGKATRDSFSLGHGSQFGSRQYLPPNPMDQSIRHVFRQQLTLQEYNALKEDIIESNQMQILEQEDIDGINGQFVRGRSSEEDVWNEVAEKPAKVSMKTIQKAFTDAQEIHEKHQEDLNTLPDRQEMVELINQHIEEADRADVISYALDFQELSPEEKSRIQTKFNISEEEIETYRFAKEAVFSGHDKGALKRLNQIVHLVSDQDAQGFALRQILRDRFHTNLPDHSDFLDFPSLDAGRDLIGEQAARLKDYNQGPSFDKDAAVRVEVQDAAEQEDYDLSQAYAVNDAYKATAMQDTFQSMQKTLAYEFDQAKQLEAEIQDLRNAIAANLQIARENFSETQESYLDFVKQQAQEHLATMEHHVGSAAPVFDFLGLHKEATSSFYESAVKNEIRALTDINGKDYIFDPSSKDTAIYEQELNIASKIALLLRKSDKKKALQQFEYVLSCLQENKIQTTVSIQAHTFEYAALAGQFEQANNLLQKLSSDYSSKFSPIDPRYLELYFRRCISNDKLEGVGYLVNYCEHYDVNVGKWQLEKFRSALNYYLNEKFDLNKICLFNKFYTAFFQSRYQNATQKKIPKEQLAKAVFGENEDLVDMKGLLQYVVEHMQVDTLYDSQTKEDSVWKMLSFFTQSPEFYQMTLKSANNQVEAKTLAEYFGHHLKEPQACARLLNVLVVVDKTSQSEQFSRLMLAKIRDHKLKHGKLPASFTKTKLRDFYRQIKASGKELSPETSEVLLSLFKAQDLHAEIFDLTKTKAVSNTDLKTYYQSEAILSLPQKNGNTYRAAMQKVENGFATKNSACHITQNTKAIFLDQGADEALAYFNKQMDSRKDLQAKRDDFYAKMFDEMYKKDSSILKPGQVTMKQFAENFQYSTEKSLRVQRQMFGIKQLASLLEEKDFDQVERLFQYYTVLREEAQILGTNFIQDRAGLGTTSISKDDLNNDECARFDHLQQRREALELMITVEEQQRLMELALVLKDQKLNMGGKTFDYIVSILNNPDWDEEIMDCAEFLAVSDEDEYDEMVEKKPEYQENDDQTAQAYLDKLVEEHDGIRPEHFDAQEVFEDFEQNMYEEINEEISSNMNQLRGMLGSDVIEPNLANLVASDDDLEYADTFTEGLQEQKNNQSDYDDGDEDEPMPEMTPEEDAFRKELGMSEDEFWKMKLMREIEYVGEDDEHDLKYASYHCGFDADLISLSQEEYENELERRSPMGEMKRQEYAKQMDEMRRNYRKIMKQREEIDLENQNPEATHKKILVPKFGEGNKYEGTDVIEVPVEEIGELNDDEAYLDSFWNEEYMEQKIGKWRRYEQKKGQAFFEAEMRDEINHYRDHMIYEDLPIEDDDNLFDPIAVSRDAHDQSLLEMKEALLHAYNTRKAEILPKAVQIFNKLQDQKLGTYKVGNFEQPSEEEKLGIYEQADEDLRVENERRIKLGLKPEDPIRDLDDESPEEVEEEPETDESDPEEFAQDFKKIKDIKGNLEKFNLLLNDVRSPILSNIQDTRGYATRPLATHFEEHYGHGADFVNQAVDVDKYLLDRNKLLKLESELGGINDNLDYMAAQLKLKKDSNYDRMWDEEEDQLELLDEEYPEKVQDLYDTFVEVYGGTDVEITKEDKIKFMKAAFKLEHGSKLIGGKDGQVSAIPSFYAIDLIQFGLKHKIPDAVRLGERILSEDNSLQAAMPRELAMQVKNFILEDSSRYYGAAMARQGPLSTAHLYHEGRQDQKGAPPLVTMSDPYWQETMKKNYRREDQWRTPSMYSWDHKEHGQIGEVFDMKTLRDKYNAYFGDSH